MANFGTFKSYITLTCGGFLDLILKLKFVLSCRDPNDFGL